MQAEIARLRAEVERLKAENDDQLFRLTKALADLNAHGNDCVKKLNGKIKSLTLKPGQVVCAEETCPRCGGDGDYCISHGGCDMEGECVEPPTYDQCEYCNGIGKVYKRVSE